MRGTGASRRVGDWTSARRYVDRRLVLETTFTTAAGVLVMTDLLALGPNNSGPRGFESPILRGSGSSAPVTKGDAHSGSAGTLPPSIARH
jgi:hypothetical protein